MSHNSIKELGLNDRGALVAAAGKLGCTVAYNSIAKLYGTNTAKGEIVLSHPDSPYDVALNKVDGLYEATTDFWGGHIEKVYGENFGKLVVKYGIEVTKRIVKLYGYQIKESVDQQSGAIIHEIGGFQ